MRKRMKLLAFGLLAIGLCPLASCSGNYDFKDDADSIYVALGPKYEVFSTQGGGSYYELLYYEWKNKNAFGITIKTKTVHHESVKRFVGCPYFITYKEASE